MTESTFDYILPKAALKGAIQIPLLYLFSHNQEWLLFANDQFNFLFLTLTRCVVRCLKNLQVSALELADFDSLRNVVFFIL